MIHERLEGVYQIFSTLWVGIAFGFLGRVNAVLLGSEVEISRALLPYFEVFYPPIPSYPHPIALYGH